MANNSERQYLHKTIMGAEVYRPRIEVSFHTETGLYHAASTKTNEYGERMNPNQQLLNVSTQKQLSSPAGFWTMTLAGTQWSQRVKPQDVAVIQMGYAGERTTTVMVGLVDKINRKRSMGGDGKPSINTTITGRDFGKLFVKDLLKFYPEISGKNASDFFLTDVGWINLMKVFTTDNIMKGSPAVIMDNVMKYIFPKIHNVSWTLWDERAATPSSKTVNVKDIIRYSFAKLNFFMPFIFTADQYEGSLWNLLERAAPKPFCELVIDTRDASEAWKDDTSGRVVPQTVEKANAQTGFGFGKDGAKVVVFLRETPYDSGYRARLVRHKLKQEDIISDDVGISDEEHYNLFWAGTTINPLGIDLKRVAPPLLNEKNANKFGLSPLEVNIEGMEVTDGLTLEGMSKTFSAKLKAWYENNHTFRSGTITLRGKADIRVGHIVEAGESDYYNEFYVEGVNQDFNVFADWTTTLQVTRGMPIAAVVDSTKDEWTPPAAKPKPAEKKSATATATSTFYTVQKGETLWTIAQKKYGDTLKWRKIWEANKDMMIKRDPRNVTDNGQWLYPGQSLIIPA